MADASAFRRARGIATGVLLLLVAIFIATHLISVESEWLRLARAMAEAGMVGGLADWFAVEALFRRPLGLPIPHTALLPSNQAKAARNVGRFFEEHFLDPVALEARLRTLAPSRRAADWLADEAHALALSRQLVAAAAGMMAGPPPRRLLVRICRWLRARLLATGGEAAIAGALATALKEGIRGPLFDEALRRIRTSVEENRETAARLVHDRSRWWITNSIDRRVAGLVVAGVLSLIDELSDPRTDLRKQFETAFDGIIDGLLRDGALERAVGQARHGLVRSGTLDRLALSVAQQAGTRLGSGLAEDPDRFARPLARMMRDLARHLVADPKASATLDMRIARTLAEMVGNLRPVLGGYVAGVISGWKPDELIYRFEAELGPDLQYIRVNGAVLGALIGGVIYTVDRLFA